MPWSVLFPFIYFEHCLTRDLLGTAFNFRSYDRIIKVYSTFWYYPLWLIPLTIFIGLVLPKHKKTAEEKKVEESKKTK